MRRVFLSALIVVSWLGHPLRMESQCNLVGPPAVTTYPPNFIRVAKTPTAPKKCYLLTPVNAFRCWPQTATRYVTTTKFVAFADPAVTTQPFCRWWCTCGTVRIDHNDGLPAELMSFSVE